MGGRKRNVPAAEAVMCPACDATADRTRILETRWRLEDRSIRRRRKCLECACRWTTLEVAVRETLPGALRPPPGQRTPARAYWPDADGTLPPEPDIVWPETPPAPTSPPLAPRAPVGPGDPAWDLIRRLSVEPGASFYLEYDASEGEWQCAFTDEYDAARAPTADEAVFAAVALFEGPAARPGGSGRGSGSGGGPPLPTPVVTSRSRPQPGPVRRAYAGATSAPQPQGRPHITKRTG